MLPFIADRKSYIGNLTALLALTVSHLEKSNKILALHIADIEIIAYWPKNLDQ